jgi:hypothetical protein
MAEEKSVDRRAVERSFGYSGEREDAPAMVRMMTDSTNQEPEHITVSL